MGRETEPASELLPADVEGFARVFVPRFDRYPAQRRDGSYVAVQRTLTMKVVEAHIRGQVTMGAYALDRHSRARWICYDADDTSAWEKLCDLAHDLAEERISSYLEKSRRGGHLWLFTNPLPGRDTRRFARQLIAGRDLHTVEIYPKQDELKTGPGSFVRLPLGIHQKTGKRYSLVTPEGDPLAPTVRNQLRILTDPGHVPDALIAEVLRCAPEPETTSPTRPFHPQPGQIAGDRPSERIKTAIRVYDFVSQYVQLDRGGKGLCPFHDDHVESFSVNSQGNYWHCFAGCGGGSVIDFWQKWRALHGQSPDFTETVTDLAKMLL